MIEATLAFTAGALVGASARALLSIQKSATAQPLPPPPPPPSPVAPRRAKTRIFYKMKQLPLTADGEDTGIREQEEGNFFPTSVDSGGGGLSRPKITDQAIAAVALKKAPPPMSIEEKRAAFFEPQRPIHAELLQRLHMFHPQL